jgi:hypothetical protein
MIYIFNPLALLLVYILYTKSSGIYKKVITVIGAVIDFVVNVTWFTVIFLDIPNECLLTERVERLKSRKGYRGKLANKICKLLNYFESNHCV